MLGDRDRLRQVVDNLLSNVRSHTPADSPMHVRVGRNGTNAVLEVEDSGPGLSDEELEQVFERFHRGDPSRTRSSGGVGLGLSIVVRGRRGPRRQRLRALDSREGTTFVVTLPLLERGSSRRSYMPIEW